jgi:hypothetical protein
MTVADLNIHEAPDGADALTAQGFGSDRPMHVALVSAAPVAVPALMAVSPVAVSATVAPSRLPTVIAIETNDVLAASRLDLPVRLPAPAQAGVSAGLGRAAAHKLAETDSSQGPEDASSSLPVVEPARSILDAEQQVPESRRAIHESPFDNLSSPTLPIEHDLLPANDIPTDTVDAVISSLDTAQWEPAAALNGVGGSEPAATGAAPGLGWAAVLAALLTGGAPVRRSQNKPPCLWKQR